MEISAQDPDSSIIFGAKQLPSLEVFHEDWASLSASNIPQMLSKILCWVLEGDDIWTTSVLPETSFHYHNYLKCHNNSLFTSSLIYSLSSCSGKR